MSTNSYVRECPVCHRFVDAEKDEKYGFLILRMHVGARYSVMCAASGLIIEAKP